MSLSYITTLPFNFTSLLVSMSVFWFGGMSAGPLWQTIYARWLPSQHFRHFLARRNSVVVFYTLVFFLFFGVHLRSVPHVPFTLIFAISAAARLATILCFLYLNRFVKTSTGLHQRDFLSNERRAEPIHIGSLVIKLCIFSALYRFAMMMGNSFTAMYLIEDIKVDNGDFILLTALPMVGKTLFLDGWGQASFGFRPILGLKVSQVVLGIIPMLWILWDSVLGLSVSMFMNGLVLGGYDLCLSLAIHHLAMERRGRVLGSHLALMNALGVLGGWLGSYLFHRYSSITDVFWISACLRLAVSAMFIASIRKLDAVSFRANHYGEFITTAFSLRPTINKVESVITSASRIRGNEKVSS